ncbi:hypothetical protein GIB67_029770 [Kingdonia uniflora]|uniref:Plantacyanin n=1 Tax=Kingdonia uniflora TaxID=39325 RepID=A0A7J7NJJ7_9MAGN|nr:hypothetical protein GIB67_029770 [Kingdonia uniflora]
MARMFSDDPLAHNSQVMAFIRGGFSLFLENCDNMARGRGNACGGAVMMVTLLLLLSHFEITSAVTYTVGGPGGWTFNTVNWPKGKRFRTGDILDKHSFNYNSVYHNVVAVTKNGYDTCKTPRGSKVYQRGNDLIKLNKGPNYFICSFSGHCEGGMKIAVYAM